MSKSYDHLTIPELLDELQQYPEYANKSTIKSKIATKYGIRLKEVRKADILNTLYHVTQFNMSQLPGELQSEIFKQDLSLLRRSPYISKSIKQSVKQELCQTTITLQEVVDYADTVVPEKVYIFPLSGLRPTTKFNVNKYYLVQYPSSTKPSGYNVMIEWIDYINNVISLSYKYFNQLNTIKPDSIRKDTTYDLLTCYHVYHRRASCTIKDYAKNKVIHLLKSKQVDLNRVKYIDLLVWYMYLRTNLQQFPVQLDKNPYFDYKVTVDDQDNIITIEPFTEPFKLISDLKTQCMIMYQQLLQQLNLLV